MSYFYGPVPSRRLGFSLGVDLIPLKTCSFNCIYCQLGETTRRTVKRFSYVNLGRFRKELKKIVRKKPKIDYITLSGSGEPTLHKGLDKIIKVIKKITKKKYPVCVITNSSLLYRKEVRRELKEADLIIPSLDAATNKNYNRIDRPHPGINFGKIIEGLIELRREFKGKIWLEIMLLGGINDGLGEAEKFKEIIKKIKPDKIQINLPVRPAANRVNLPDKDKINKIKRILADNVEVIADFPKMRQVVHPEAGFQILNLLKRRPVTFSDLSNSIGIKSYQLNEYLKTLVNKKRIKRYIYQGKKYFLADD